MDEKHQDKQDEQAEVEGHGIRGKARNDEAPPEAGPGKESEGREPGFIKDDDDDEKSRIYAK